MYPTKDWQKLEAQAGITGNSLVDQRIHREKEAVAPGRDVTTRILQGLL